MEERATMLEDTLDRLLKERVTAATIREAEEGVWPQELWQELVGMGLTEIFRGLSDEPWRDAAAVMRLSGRHALPVPLAETILASALLPEEEFDPAEPLAVIAVKKHEDPAWPWPGKVRRAIGIGENGAAFWLKSEGEAGAPARSLAREPRRAVKVSAAAAARAGARPLAALMRAAQMAGAIKTVLELTLGYAQTRVQFGKPIGAFQAVQNQLAVLAGNAAAATRSVDAAIETLSRGEDATRDILVAKIRAGEAAGLAAAIAHQLHGAIGFTEEHTLHLFTRRLWSWRAQFGTESEWAIELGRSICAAGAQSLWPSIATRR